MVGVELLRPHSSAGTDTELFLADRELVLFFAEREVVLSSADRELVLLLDLVSRTMLLGTPKVSAFDTKS